MSLFALLTTRPPPVPHGVGKVHRCADDEEPESLESGDEAPIVCTGCGHEKPADQYYFNAPKCRRWTRCKECAKAEKRKRDQRKTA